MNDTAARTGRADSRTGRPRDAQRDAELVEAAQELLIEIGYDRLTIDAVAARVGAGRATVYRRWPNKTALVLDAVTALHSTQPLPDTGTLRGDLMALAQGFLEAGVRHTAVVGGLLTAMSRDPELRATVSEVLGRPRLAEFAGVITAAVERGEARPDCDVPLLARVFPGLAFHQVAGIGLPLDAAFVEQVVDEILMPLLRQP